MFCACACLCARGVRGWNRDCRDDADTHGFVFFFSVPFIPILPNLLLYLPLKISIGFLFASSNFCSSIQAMVSIREGGRDGISKWSCQKHTSLLHQHIIFTRSIDLAFECQRLFKGTRSKLLFLKVKYANFLLGKKKCVVFQFRTHILCIT